MLHYKPFFFFRKLAILIITMGDRSRSRSPDRGAPPAEEAPPVDTGAPPPGDSGAPPPSDGAPPAEGGGDEVKLYVGNLDYGA